MTKQKVEKILRDPAYAGVLVYGKNEPIDLIELYGFTPAISVPDFMKMHKLSSDGQLIRLARKFNRAENVEANLLRGMVMCGYCNQAMSAGLTAKKTATGVTKYFYYRCDTDGCIRHNKSIRAKEIISYACGFLAEQPFSSQKSYDHYVEEMKTVSSEKLSQARSNLASLKSKRAKLLDKFAGIKEMFADRAVESNIKESYKVDFNLTDTAIKTTDKEIEKATELVNAGKISIYTYKEFLELMENMPKIIREMKNMGELDYILKKIFSNFTVRGKNVEFATLNEPFYGLCDAKMFKGGASRARTPLGQAPQGYLA